MKILVLPTGGTIGSETQGGVISPNEKAADALLDLYRNSALDDTEFTFEKIADALSENIRDSFYEILVNYLLSLDTQELDGVIILHGTDTLEYTAALVSMACRSFTLPVGFVSANLPLENSKSNGVCNFKSAVQYISAGGKGFFVPYRNHSGRVQIHLATRLYAADSVYDDFNSIYDCTLAQINNDRIDFNNKPLLPLQKDLAIAKPTVLNKALKLNKKILVIKTYPDIDYSVFNLLGKNIAAVLNLAYHSGTAPSYLCDFVNECKNMGIDNYICPVKSAESLYESADVLLKCGVKPLAQMTSASALAKMKLAYNCDDLSINPVTDNLYYEFIL